MTLRNTVIAFFLILAAVVITKTGGDGATARTPTGTSRTVLCSVLPQRVTKADNRIIAAGRFQCDAPGPDGLTFTVHLQRNDNGQWTTLSGQAFVANGQSTTLDRSAAERTKQVSVPCAAGTYRTWVEGSVYDNGVTRKLSRSGGERRNPCG